ncbi:MAG: class I SAM-dependent methyltransferase [Planctomycetota bacterium]
MVTITPTVSTGVDQFESIYAGAAGDAKRIPWAAGRPSPALVNWLNVIAPSLVRCGARVAVVGCGLGDDARALIGRGYDVTAFDCSPTAIDWARERDPDNAQSYVQADLFHPPGRWRRRFDLVVEVNTLQSLAPDLRPGAMNAVSELLSPHGHLLVICRGCDEPAGPEDGPPWAFTMDELLESGSVAGLTPVEPPASFLDDEEPPIRRIRALFRRA